MNNTVIFTEIVNCAPVGRIMLESFHKYHDRRIAIFCTSQDVDLLGDIKEHPNNNFCIISDELAEKFKKGHAGTAEVFAGMFSPEPDRWVAQCDSDVVFKKESLSLIEDAFAEGYDIVGSRRCYKNNPGKVPVPDGIPDAVSTYFFGMKTSVVPKGYSFEQLANMWQGHNTGLDHMILDFADCITLHALRNGARIKFLDSNLVGGQDAVGSKVNNFKSNLHLDMGSHLLHMGGVGSGYAVEMGLSNPEPGYADWSRGRWSLFSKLFYDIKTPYEKPTVYAADSRWVSGSFDENIFNLVKEDLVKTV